MQRWARLAGEETGAGGGKRIVRHKDGKVDSCDMAQDPELETEELRLHSLDQC